MDEQEYLEAIKHLLPKPVDPNRHSWWVLYKVLCWGLNTPITNSEWETVCKLRRNTTCKIGLHTWRWYGPGESSFAYKCVNCGKTKGRYVT